MIIKNSRAKYTCILAGQLTQMQDNFVDQNCTCMHTHVCVHVCIPSRPASFPPWHMSPPCVRVSPEFFCASSSLTHLPRMGNWAWLLFYNDFISELLWPGPDCHGYDCAGSSAGSSEEQGTGGTSPALQLWHDVPKQALTSRARVTGGRDRKDLSRIRNKLHFTIQIRFLGLFYYENLVGSEIYWCCL